MTAHPQLVTTEQDPRTHQGPAALIRDILTTDARMRYTRPQGAPAYTTHDLQDCGVEQALDDLLKEEEVASVAQRLAALTAEFEDFRRRVDANFVRHAEQRSLDRARIAKLEELVQEREKEIDALRRQVARNIERLDDIAQHNDRIANTICPVVLGVDQILALVKAAPKLLALVEG